MLGKIMITQEGDKRSFLFAGARAREQQFIQPAEFSIQPRQAADTRRRPWLGCNEPRLQAQLRKPLGLDMQHLVAPCLAGLGVAGMHPLRRHQHQRAWGQPLLPITCASEDAAPRIHRADGECRVAMSLVTGAAVAGPAAFHPGQGRIAPE
ncbi:hypothetical protein D3C79_715710 [compost metagenome]